MTVDDAMKILAEMPGDAKLVTRINKYNTCEEAENVEKGQFSRTEGTFEAWEAIEDCRDMDINAVRIG